MTTLVRIAPFLLSAFLVTPIRAGEPAVGNDAIAYLEIRDLGSLIRRVEGSPVLESIQSSPQSIEAWKQPQARKALAAIQIAEKQLDMDLWTFFSKLFGGTVTMSLHPNPERGQPDGLMIIRPEDEEFLPRVRETLQPFLTLAEDNITLEEQDGRLYVETDNDLTVVYAEGWLGIANRREVLDRAGNTDGESIADLDSYQAMAAQMGDDHLVRLFINAEMISQGAGGRFLPEKADNALASLLFAGIMEQLAHSPWAGLTLNVTDSGVALTGGVAASELDEKFSPFFSDSKTAGAPAFPELKNRIAGFTLHRDFAAWYQSREDLIQEDQLPEFDKFEAGIGNFLPNRDFGTDVLPLLGSNLQFVTAPQDFAHLDGRPGVQLPGFAMIVDLAEPDEGADIVKLFLQALSFILNVSGGEEGREPMVADSETWNDTQISYTRHLEKPKGDRLPMAYNFMLASAQVEDRYIISSSLDLCRQLVDSLKNPPDNADRLPNRNFELEANFGPAADLMEANRDFLVARGIQEGKSREQAMSEFEFGVSLVRKLKQFSIRIGQKAESLQATLRIDW